MKPKVLIANKFYYPRGGDCVCAMSLERMLEANGYQTAVFAMDYPENIPSPWSSYFASEVSFSGPITGKLKAVRRMLGHGDIRKSFAKILADFNPDIVHLHNIHSYLSPQLAVMAREAGCRVVWTLHDYKLVCPSYSCLADGGICEACVGASPRGVYRKRCMKGSRAAGLMAWIEARKWSPVKLQRYVDAFICPSEFMKQMMIKGGYDPDKLFVNCNYVDGRRLAGMSGKRSAAPAAEPYYCYVGRLSREKGVRTLLKAASSLPYKLKIAGSGPLADELKNEFDGCRQIEFLGMLDGNAVGQLLSGAAFSVVPSEWYENNPLSVIESLSVGTPVVGAEIGGIPELITPGVNGLLARQGDAVSLAAVITQAFGRQWDREAIAAGARQRFAADAHLARLENIYRSKSIGNFCSE